MELTQILTVIENGVFPIGMCGLLFWYMVKQQEAHKAEMDAVKDSLNSNTLAIQHLTDMIAKGEEKDER